jgi:serine/threonine protein kinase
MGAIWSARHARLDRAVTLRVFGKELGSAPHFVQQLREQLRQLHPRLAHDNVARVLSYNYGEDGPIQFEVMEPLDGVPISHQVGPLPPAAALRIVAAVAGALEAAHRLELVHGALTGDNVLLTTQGVKVVDFGVAVAAWSAARDEEDGRAPKGKLPRPVYHMVRPSPSSDILALEGLLIRLITGTQGAASDSSRTLAFLASLSLSGDVRTMVTLIKRAGSQADAAHAVVEALLSAAEDLEARGPDLSAAVGSGAPAQTVLTATPPSPTIELPKPEAPEPRITLPDPLPTPPIEGALVRPGHRPAGRDHGRRVGQAPGPSQRRGRAGPSRSPREAPSLSRPPPASGRPLPHQAPTSSAGATPEKRGSSPDAEAAGGWTQRITLFLAVAGTWVSVFVRRFGRGTAALVQHTRRGAGGARAVIRGLSRSFSQLVLRQRRAVAGSVAVAFVLVAAILVFTLVRPGANEGSRFSRPRPSPEPSVATAPSVAGVRVPNVSGLTALEASDHLVRLGLVLAEARPTAGPAGEVVRTEPSAGDVVAPGAFIVLFVGTESARIGDD